MRHGEWALYHQAPVVTAWLTAMASRHKLDQTAFRLPGKLMAQLRSEAARCETTMTAVVIEALEARVNDYEEPELSDTRIPGHEGSAGPFPSQYSEPHVYARDIHSGAGNCVCGRALGDQRHVEAAPGVPVPDRLRA
jgi:hypothetical protein